jgi:myo-inositol-1(or 4)-monophosphatase
MRVETRNSIAYRMCLVASGAFDAAIALTGKNEWDLAAAVLLVREAGGVATDRFGKSLVFNKPSVIQQGAIAAGPALHPLLLEKLHTQMRKWGVQGI